MDSLHKERCRTAVISNKADYAVKILCDDFFPGKFDAVYGERESMGIKKKPDPHIPVSSNALISKSKSSAEKDG